MKTKNDTALEIVKALAEERNCHCVVKVSRGTEKTNYKWANVLWPSESYELMQRARRFLKQKAQRTRGKAK